MLPYRDRLFALLRAQREVSVGLTVPYLMGALREPVGRVSDNEGEGFHDLIKLLTCMRDSAPAGFVVRIAECNDLHQPLAALYPAPGGFNEREAIPSKTGGITLFVQGIYRPNGTIDPVGDFLWGELGDVLLQGRYSFRGSAYCPFNDVELGFIKAAFRRHW